MKTLCLCCAVNVALACFGVFVKAQTLHWHESSLVGAQTTCFASVGKTVFAGTIYDVGMYRSTDNGKTWAAVDSTLYLHNVWALGVKGKTLYSGRDKLFQTTDEGRSWSEVDSTKQTTTYLYNCFATSGTTVFIGTHSQGVFRLKDSSSTLEPIDSGLASLAVLSLLAKGSTVFVATDGGMVYRSTNNGDVWTRVAPDFGPLYGRTLVAIDTTIFAGDAFGVNRSTNNGDSWEPCDSGLSNLDVIALATDGKNLFAGSLSRNGWTAGVFMSTNMGDTWSTEVTGLTIDGGGRSFEVIGNTLLLGNSTGIYYADLTGITTVSPDVKHSITMPSFSIHPNPVRDELRVEYSSVATNVECNLFNVLGERVAMSRTKEFGVSRINVSALPDGMYIVQVGTASKMEMRIVAIAR